MWPWSKPKPLVFDVKLAHPGDVLILLPRERVTSEYADRVRSVAGELIRATGLKCVVIDRNEFEVLVLPATGEAQ